MNTMSTQKTNSNKNQTKQRCLHQPNITAPFFFTMEQVGSHHSLVLSIAERKDSWFLQCVISTLHHRPMFSTNCMWMCVYMSHAYIYIYIYIIDCLCEILQECVPQNQTDTKFNPNPKIILFKVVYDNFG
jgi:hypothetical protein